MSRPSRLDDQDVRERLAELTEWELVEGKLVKTFRFHDFSEAWAFMSRVALAAEKLDHHPDWSNVYNSVHVCLHTHDAQGLTSLDFKLAAHMDSFAS